MIPRPIARLAIALLLLAACGRSRGPATVRDVAGCWLLTWRSDTSYSPMPDSVWLDSAAAGSGGRRRVAFGGWRREMGARSIGDPLPWYRHYGASGWRMGTADSIHIDFSDNWTRWDTRLRVRGDRLAGTAQFRADFEPAPPPPVEVRGRRFPCPTSLR